MNSDEETDVFAEEALRRAFRTPPPEYGPIDCWWWEAADLSRENMRRQLEELKEAGVRGTWYYPRFLSNEPLSSNPAYWTPEWWDIFAFSLQEHKRLGLVAWMSDWTAFEFFQNKVRAERGENPRLMGRRLTCYRQSSVSSAPLVIEVPAEEQILHAAAYRTTDAGVDYASQLMLHVTVANNRLVWNAPDAGWMLVVVTAQPNDLDYLDQAVADRWCEVHLGAFAEHVPEFIGNTLEAYGPDEMYVLRGNILYSSALLDRFRREKGYDPLPFLGGMFLDIGARTDKIRCDYYEVMVSLLDENFYRRIADWLHERGMCYGTIATWGRANPLLQTSHYGDFFRMMSHFDVTGNEDPDEGSRPADITERKFIDAKFASSIAHLGGRERSAVCAYWGSGWGATQQQNLAWTLANYAFGHNFYNAHGALYSTLGGWYEWVPPSIHFRQPYWQYWSAFTGWLRRLSCIMSQGAHAAEVAILYPLTTMHAGWTGGEEFSEAAREASDGVISLAKVIYRSGIDFDFIDDRFLSEAAVIDGKLAIAGHAFQAVVLPPLTTIRRDTLEKLREFHAAGGVVLAFGRLPAASPEYGREDPVVRSLVEEIFGGTSGHSFFIPTDEEQVPRILSSAIARAVTITEPDVFYSHRKAGGLDIVLLVNTHAEKRRVTVAVRAEGESEIWDPFTGAVHPLYCYDIVDGAVVVYLDMAAYQGTILAVAPRRDRPRVIGHNLDDIRDIQPREGSLRIDGLCKAGGHKTVTLVHDGIEYAVEAEETIGPEARQFRYCEEEEGGQGIASGWHQPGFDDAGWPRVLYTHGPYWWRLGPFGEAHEPRQIIDGILAGGFDAGQSFDLAGRPFRWEPLSFSQQHGSWIGMKQTKKSFGGLTGVDDEFLPCEAIPGGQPIARYFFTSVIAPEEGEWMLEVGGTAPFPREAWVNGRQVMTDVPEPESLPENSHYHLMNRRQMSEDAADGAAAPDCARVRLHQGRNDVLLRIVQPRGEALNAYAVFYDPAAPPAANPRIPLLRWFRQPQKLRFDIMPERSPRAGWYRFIAPPGLSAMKCRLNAAGMKAWVDGEPVVVQSGAPSPDVATREVLITLDGVRKTCSQVAFRIELVPGRYAGAAFEGPVQFTCAEGEIPPGDWCESGLEAYSGIGVYSRTIHLDRHHVEGNVMLDLGTVATVGEVFVNGTSAGVGMGQPFSFDITGLVHEGENLLEVRVANTLANHMSSYPTRFILPGQMLSGLLGPVHLQFARRVSITAVAHPLD